MDHPLDDRLQRKLVKRRGGLYAFDRLTPSRTAIVVIDAVALFIDGLPGGAALVAPINALTAAARRNEAMVAWVTPTPPDSWPSAAASLALLGPQEAARYRAGMRPGGPGCRFPPALAVEPADWIGDKLGHSAFFPGHCALPGHLRDRGIDTVILAGLLTDICIEGSARDAHEGGFRVLVCADGTAANDQAQHLHCLRRLARVYADIRSAAALAVLLDGSAS